MFTNRSEAGKALAGHLSAYARRRDVIVLGLPRGGVPVAYEVAKALDAPLDVLVVRKLGVPFHSELAMGAIASGGAVFLNDEVIRLARVRKEQIDEVLSEERAELQRREELYRSGKPPLDLRDRVVVIVDDGMATGASMHAAATALRSLQPAKLVVAVPVAPLDAAERLGTTVDDFVCVKSPADFHAVGQFYRDFNQTTDDEVRTLLAKAAKERRAVA